MISWCLLMSLDIPWCLLMSLDVCWCFSLSPSLSLNVSLDIFIFLSLSLSLFSIFQSLDIDLNLMHLISIAISLFVSVYPSISLYVSLFCFCSLSLSLSLSFFLSLIYDTCCFLFQLNFGCPVTNNIVVLCQYCLFFFILSVTLSATSQPSQIYCCASLFCFSGHLLTSGQKFVHHWNVTVAP